MIYTLGESLLDIIFDTTGKVTATPGGAMLNVAVSLARRATKSILISEWGDDMVGDKIDSFLKDNAIDTTFIRRYKNIKTSLALAFLDEEAKPSYSFYKHYPEKRSLITNMNFTAKDFLLFGSLYSLDPAIRKDILTIVKKAKQSGAFVIYDPNIRHAHHLKNINIKEAIIQNIAISDMVKGSDEDFTNIFGDGDSAFWIDKIKTINKEAIIVNTLGAKGSVADVKGVLIEKSSLPVKVVSTVGAGDAFNAGMLFKMNQLKNSISGLSLNQWNNILYTATLFASEVCGLNENYVKKNKDNY